MEREKKVFKNTALFALGSVFTKLIGFIVMPIYTFYMSPSEFGIVDIIVSSATIAISIFSLSILEGVFRFTLNKLYDKKSVFSNGIVVIIFGGILIFTIYSILYFLDIPYVKEYGLIISIYLFFNMLHPVIQYFVKGLEKVGVFVFNGVLYSSCYLVFGLLFVAQFKLGVNGYLLGFIVADIVCSIFMILKCKLYQYFSFKYVDKKLLKKMLAYSIPMIFNSIAWWIMNLSDKYVVTAFLGVNANGILAVSHKIPSIISMLYSIFSQAFVLSAISDYDLQKDKEFFINIFNVIIFILTFASATIIVLIEPITRLIIEPSYYQSWEYVPMMLLAAVFGAMMTYAGIVYTIKMKNFKFAVSTIIGGITNFVVCFVMIKYIGLHAAALSTLIANIVMFLIRWIDIRRDIVLKIDITSFICIAIVLAQSIICMVIENITYVISVNSCLLFLLILVNIKKIKKVIIMFKDSINKKHNKVDSSTDIKNDL